MVQHPARSLYRRVARLGQDGHPRGELEKYVQIWYLLIKKSLYIAFCIKFFDGGRINAIYLGSFNGMLVHDPTIHIIFSNYHLIWNFCCILRFKLRLNLENPAHMLFTMNLKTIFILVGATVSPFLVIQLI